MEVAALTAYAATAALPAVYLAYQALSSPSGNATAGPMRELELLQGEPNPFRVSYLRGDMLNHTDSPPPSPSPLRSFDPDFDSPLPIPARAHVAYPQKRTRRKIVIFDIEGERYFWTGRKLATKATTETNKIQTRHLSSGRQVSFVEYSSDYRELYDAEDLIKDGEIMYVSNFPERYFQLVVYRNPIGVNREDRNILFDDDSKVSYDEISYRYVPSELFSNTFMTAIQYLTNSTGDSILIDVDEAGDQYRYIIVEGQRYRLVDGLLSMFPLDLLPSTDPVDYLKSFAAFRLGVSEEDARDLLTRYVESIQSSEEFSSSISSTPLFPKSHAIADIPLSALLGLNDLAVQNIGSLEWNGLQFPYFELTIPVVRLDTIPRRLIDPQISHNGISIPIFHVEGSSFVALEKIPDTNPHVRLDAENLTITLDDTYLFHFIDQPGFSLILDNDAPKIDLIRTIEAHNGATLIKYLKYEGRFYLFPPVIVRKVFIQVDHSRDLLILNTGAVVPYVTNKDRTWRGVAIDDVPNSNLVQLQNNLEGDLIKVIIVDGISFEVYESVRSADRYDISLPSTYPHHILDYFPALLSLQHRKFILGYLGPLPRSDIPVFLPVDTFPRDVFLMNLLYHDFRMNWEEEAKLSKVTQTPKIRKGYYSNRISQARDLIIRIPRGFRSGSKLNFRSPMPHETIQRSTDAHQKLIERYLSALRRRDGPNATIPPHVLAELKKVAQMSPQEQKKLARANFEQFFKPIIDESLRLDPTFETPVREHIKAEIEEAVRESRKMRRSVLFHKGMMYRVSQSYPFDHVFAHHQRFLSYDPAEDTYALLQSSHSIYKIIPLSIRGVSPFPKPRPKQRFTRISDPFRDIFNALDLFGSHTPKTATAKHLELGNFRPSAPPNPALEILPTLIEPNYSTLTANLVRVGGLDYIVLRLLEAHYTRQPDSPLFALSSSGYDFMNLSEANTRGDSANDVLNKEANELEDPTFFFGPPTSEKDSQLIEEFVSVGLPTKGVSAMFFKLAKLTHVLPTHAFQDKDDNFSDDELLSVSYLQFIFRDLIPREQIKTILNRVKTQLGFIPQCSIEFRRFISEIQHNFFTGHSLIFTRLASRQERPKVTLDVARFLFYTWLINACAWLALSLMKKPSMLILNNNSHRFSELKYTLQTSDPIPSLTERLQYRRVIWIPIFSKIAEVVVGAAPAWLISVGLIAMALMERRERHYHMSIPWSVWVRNFVTPGHVLLAFLVPLLNFRLGMISLLPLSLA